MLTYVTENENIKSFSRSFMNFIISLLFFHFHKESFQTPKNILSDNWKLRVFCIVENIKLI